MGAVARKNETDHTSLAWTPGREEVLAPYRHLRQIITRHQSEVMSYVSSDAIPRHTRRLGFAAGKTIVMDEDEMGLVLDLAAYTAPPGRSRAIDRLARSASFPPGSDESLVLEAMRQARFSILAFDGFHEAAGVLVEDLFRGEQLWLIDLALEKAAPDVPFIAARIGALDGFFVNLGGGVPFDRPLLQDVIADVPALRRKSLPEAVEDWRFAEAVYRISARHARA